MDTRLIAREYGRWLGGGLAAGFLLGAVLAQAVLARGAPAGADAPPALAATLAVEAPAAVAWTAIAVTEPEAVLALADVVSPSAEIVDAPDTSPSRVRLGTVPFRTQRDGSRFAGSNCGPAALSMVLDAYGISQDTETLRYLSHTYQGTWGRRGGTALEHMARVAEDFGVRAEGLYSGDQFRRWSLADVRAEVERGHPVIALVKYRLLPGREYATVRYDHYIVLWGTTADGFRYNDPIYPGDDEGYARFISDAQLDAAMAPTMHPRQAVSFS